jgi:hypothetical protein
MMERAELGIDGNCGFALLGENIQEGEAEFVEISEAPDSLVMQSDREKWAAKRAFQKLQQRLVNREFSYFLGSGYPHSGA